jgi:beta-N-acetylhexosaminidase
MEAIAARLPAMSEDTAKRLDRALAGSRQNAASEDQAQLAARRDALLALAEARA